MVFQTKKIRSETLSEYLLSIRESLGFSQDDVVLETGIQKKFLDMIEQGSLEALPPEVYACGFLKKLAGLYHVGEEELITQYKKERGIALPINPVVAQVNLIKARSIFAITPKTFSLAFVSIFILGTVGYVGFQLKSMSKDPTITVSEPRSNARVDGSFVRVAGTTEPGNQLSINSEAVFVGENGDFETTVSVAPGQAQLVFLARNKFGKSSSTAVAVVRNEDREESITILPEPGGVTILVTALAPISLVLSIDDNLAPPVNLVSFETKQVSARRKILLSTSDAGSTKVLVNGRDVGTLGKSGEELKNIPFTNTSISVGKTTDTNF